MNVFVTGGSGKLGQAVVHELIAHGHSVVSADRRKAAPGDIAQSGTFRFVETNLSDLGQVVSAMQGCDGLIHLGAIPTPSENPAQVVFSNNTGATFIALHAAELLGIRRAVIASSLSALGTVWAPQRFLAVYVPVDEAHPLLPHDAYSLSKEVDERTAEMFHRRTGMQIAALRFCWIASAEEIAAMVPVAQAAPQQRDADLWAYVDVRDAASACRLSLEADDLGFDVFNITAADTLLAIPTEEALAQFAPGIEKRAPIAGRNSAFSIERARTALSWEPIWSWAAGHAE